MGGRSRAPFFSAVLPVKVSDWLPLLGVAGCSLIPVWDKRATFEVFMQLSDLYEVYLG